MIEVAVKDMDERLAILLRSVQAREEVVFTHEGREVARLVASTPDHRGDIVERFRRVSEGATLGGLSIPDLIDEGRR